MCAKKALETSRGHAFAQLPDIIFAEVHATAAATHDHRKDNQCDREAGREQARSSQMELTHAASRRPTAGTTTGGNAEQRRTMAAHSNTQSS